MKKPKHQYIYMGLGCTATGVGAFGMIGVRSYTPLVNSKKVGSKVKPEDYDQKKYEFTILYAGVEAVDAEIERLKEIRAKITKVEKEIQSKTRKKATPITIDLKRVRK